jgi:hypothetical protein
MRARSWSTADGCARSGRRRSPLGGPSQGDQVERLGPVDPNPKHAYLPCSLGSGRRRGAVLMDQSSQDDTLVGVGPPGPSPGTPSHVSPQGTSFASVPRGDPMSKQGNAISFAGNLTDQPELRHTEAGIARAMVRVAVSGHKGAGGVVHHRDRVAGPGRACRPVALQGQPGRGRGPAPAAGLDG